MRKLALLVAMLIVTAASALAQEKGKGGKKGKATPETSGTLADGSVLGLDAGVLLVGSGLVVRRIVR